MARSISEIYDSLVAEKNSMSSLQELQPNVDNAQTLLKDVDSSSRVSDWRLWLWLFAFGVHIIEVSRDLFRAEVDAKVKATKSHNLQWYQLTALAFQYGYDLVWDEDLQKFVYDTEDADSLIVTRCATEESQGRVIIKVANEAGALDNDQLDAFKTYMGQLKDAGTDLLIISTAADDFKTTVTVYYDPLVLKPDGSLILDSSRKPVEEQIDAYIHALAFNGKFVVNGLEDYLQAAEGVSNPDLQEVQIKSTIDPYAVVDVDYLPYSGYYNWDSANSNIIYKPANV